MNKTQTKLIERLRASSRKTSTGEVFINLSNLAEINQAANLMDSQPDKFFLNIKAWRCADFGEVYPGAALIAVRQ